MWELMRIGIDMQQRMIEVHAKGLRLTQDMLHAVEQQQLQDMGTASGAAKDAQQDFVDQWFNFWNGRI